MKHLPPSIELLTSLVGARLHWRHPLYLVHALTARCNARCGFCAWNPDFYNPREQLPTPLIKKLYDDARRSGFVALSLWGGEPLLHHDFGEIASHAHRLGFVTNLVTNGFLLERKLDDVLPNIDRISISLDHPSTKHDELRGIPGLFDRIVHTTRVIRARDPQKTILFICTLQQANVDPTTVRQLVDLMSSLGVLGVFNGLREEAASDAPDTKLDRFAASQAQLSEAFATLSLLKRSGAPILNSNTHLEMMRRGPPVYRCHWPKLMLPVEANGDVVDCMHWGTRPVANVKDLPFTEILRHPRLRALAGPAGEACHKCVSIHRVELSEVWDGNLEPLLSWRQLAKPRPLAETPM